MNFPAIFYEIFPADFDIHLIIMHYQVSVTNGYLADGSSQAFVKNICNC